jgi:REP element-mobilizing transposase RayT
MLVSHFAVEVLAYAVMNNHSHFVLWLRPSVAAGWSEEEVARRWLSVFGNRVDGPTEQDIVQAVANAERIEVWRRRLGDVSWFMRCLNEWLARKANAEDECTGRFWEGRFTSQLIEDEGALLACMAYVDLNPVRAGMAEGLEGNRLTSVHDRICARRARRRLSSFGVEAGNSRGTAEAREETQRKRVERERELTEQQSAMVEEAKAECERDAWLCRFADRVKDSAPRDSRVKDSAPRDSRVVEGFAPRDLDEEGGPGAHTVLGMGFADYLELLEWTGKCLAEGKRGVLPESARPVLEQMELDVDNWVGTVERYGSLYWRVAGKVENLKKRAREMGRQWLAGQRKSRGVFKRVGRENENAASAG